MRTVVADDGVVDLRGPAVFGKKGERFLYLTWGDVGAGGSFAGFRRAKLMIGDIEPELLAVAARVDGVLVASLSLTDERGGPAVPCQAAGDQLAVRLTARGSRGDRRHPHRSPTGPRVGLTSMIGVPSSASRSLTVSVDPSIEVTMTR